MPGGSRTSVVDFGGVIPRNRCGFNSVMAAVSTPAARATAANGVDAGTDTESYWKGGRTWSSIPYRAGSFAMSAAAINCGT